ncbi:30 kDa heat shock protein [Blumeria hordei DH14]|uniref:30 kDa heat shock protein n=1 Tax=Blumeria graminis f. sp. hordei (strain DH14) TaxID=546991 RepID=N1J9P3_BLUG1|nr:30 kDa heat shock protein [Blumeria hordei DH14]
MSMYSRSLNANDQASIPPIIRLLGEFDRYSRNSDRSSEETDHPSRNSDRTSRHINSFTPKFDLKEVPDAFELYGELPGVDQKDVDIEFTDASTLTIKGRVERKFSESCRENAQIGNENTSKAPRKATVEDEVTTQENTVSVTKSKPTTNNPAEKFWVMERSIGEFSRSFEFPVRIEQDTVRASMKNGILSVFVPKARKQEGRKITIQ